MPRPRITQYGIYKTEAGEVSVFTVGKGGPLPPNVLDMGETRRAFKAYRLAARMRSQFLFGSDDPPDVEPAPRTLSEGDVAIHSDGDGVHKAVILRIDRPDCHALFFTTHPSWNRESRRASPEEAALAGFPTDRDMWIAPVKRSLSEFTRRGSIPEHRLKALQEEFPYSVTYMGIKL